MEHKHTSITLSTADTMRRLRDRDVSDETIGYAFGVSRQRVHQKLGPKPVKMAEPPPPEPAPTMNLATFLRSYRATHKLSQAQLARMINASQSAVAHWENGESCRYAKLIISYLMEHAP